MMQFSKDHGTTKLTVKADEVWRDGAKFLAVRLECEVTKREMDFRFSFDEEAEVLAIRDVLNYWLANPQQRETGK